MDKETFEKHKPFAGETKPSMLRRRIGHDYQSRRIYLITMTIAGRRPLLGKLVGNCNAPEGTDEAPHIELTELGLRVRCCWMAIENHYPAIKNKVYRELYPSAATLSPQRNPDNAQGLLWDKGFNDHILDYGVELDRWFQYLRDNPRRLAIRRTYADYFKVRFDMVVAGQSYSAIGNRFLLNHPQRLPIRLSRRLTDEEIEKSVSYYLTLARQGAVLVSPAISKGEKAVMRAALNNKLPLIFITSYGFTQFSHPGHQYYDACAEGRLLLLAPWPHQNRKETLTRTQCLQLNSFTQEICQHG